MTPEELVQELKRYIDKELKITLGQRESEKDRYMKGFFDGGINVWRKLEILLSKYEEEQNHAE